MRERLLIWIERWTGLPLTEETARAVAADRLVAIWDEHMRRLDEKLRTHGGPAGRRTRS